MAGHSKRHNIKHKKAREDAKRSKVYAKIAKLISVAARAGADPEMNPALQQALQKAKYNSLPKDVITKAIQKGSGHIQNSEDFEEILYEGYGPGGVGFLVKVLTDNPNRTNGNIKLIFQKGGGDVAKPGAVSWGFREQGEIFVVGCFSFEERKGKKIRKTFSFDQENLELFLMDQDVISYHFVDQKMCCIFTTKENFLYTCKALEQGGYDISQADLIYIPDNPIQVEEIIYTKNISLQDALEEDDDVDSVWHSMKG